MAMRWGDEDWNWIEWHGMGARGDGKGGGGGEWIKRISNKMSNLTDTLIISLTCND